MLITGASGFIGQNLLKLTTGTPLDIIHGEDVCDIRVLQALYRGGPIIHLAAQAGIPQSIENPAETYRTNTNGTLVVCEFARQVGAKVIFASSCAVKKPNNPYAASKLCAETIIKAYGASYGLKYAILRLANVYGPLSDRKSSVVANMIKTATHHKQIVVEGGEQTRDFIYVEDVCRHILNLAYSDQSGVYNVASGMETSISDLAQVISEKIPSEIISQPKRDGEVKRSNIKPDLVCETLLSEGLNKTLEYYGV